VPQPNVSKHLRVLREAGLVTSRVDGQRRLYRVDAEPLREVDEWVARYRGLWTHALDQLEAHLDDVANKRGGRRGR
jgi:DNA-binding transcriptional ArsR family regulator